MKNIITLIVLLCFVNSCSKAQELNYAKKLDVCFNKKELKVLNRACEVFENQLTKRYSQSVLEEAYLTYLMDLGSQKIPPNYFFSNESKEILMEMKAIGLFDKIWMNIDSIESIPGPDFDEIVIAPTKQKKDKEISKKEKTKELFCLNPNADYFKCTTAQITNPKLIEYYKVYEIMPDVSHTLKSTGLGMTLKKEDLKNDVLKLSIAIEFFIEMTILFSD